MVVFNIYKVVNKKKPTISMDLKKFKHAGTRSRLQVTLYQHLVYCVYYVFVSLIVLGRVSCTT